MLSSIALTLLLTLPHPDTSPPPVPETDSGTVQIAICLDTSGSMSGLINSARQKLWAIVNDLATAEPTPSLEIALLSYGNDGLQSENGWVTVVCPFTDDLDVVSESLFSLTTNGGTEYVGRVIGHAVDQLQWDPSGDALKLVFVAGNESADQDLERPFREVCRQAIGQGIMVNSIYCTRSEGAEIAAGWREVATLSDGHFAAIDQDQGTIVIETPFDQELATLSGSLNGTYLPYGARGVAGAQNQRAQDANAVGLNDAAAAARCGAKAWTGYNCETWDLVDALGRKTVELSKLETEDLPEVMRPMTNEERLRYVESMRTKREEIQKQVQLLTQKRSAHLTEELARRALSEGTSFDLAVRRAVREQAKSKGFQFKAALPAPTPQEAKPKEPVVEPMKIGDC